MVVLDNLGAHKGERMRELTEERSRELVVLAALLAGPQLHRGGVLEGKGVVARRAGARTRKASIEAMGRVSDAVTAEDTKGSPSIAATGFRPNLYDNRFKGATSTA